MTTLLCGLKKALNTPPIIHGEMFCLLEQRTKRTTEIGKRIAATWDSIVSVEISGDQRTVHYTLGSSELEMTTDMVDNMGKPDYVLPFDFFAYKPSMMIGFALIKTDALTASKPKLHITDSILTSVRSNFIDVWYDKESQKKYNVPLFAMHKYMKDNGTLYNYHKWLLSRGDPDDFSQWCNTNRDPCTTMFTSIKQGLPNLESEPRFCRKNLK